MPKSKSNRSKKTYLLKNISNKSLNFLANRVGNVGKLGSRAVRISRNIVGVGTGAANRVLGVGVSLGRKISKRVRKSIRRKK
jgi:hypothetical protein